MIDVSAGLLSARQPVFQELPELTWFRAYGLMRLGRVDEAIGVVTDGLRQPLAQHWTARLRALHGLILGNDGRHAEAAAVAEQARHEGEQTGDRLAVGYALLTMSFVNLRDASRVNDYTDSALKLIDTREETTDLRFILLVNKSFALARMGRQAEADAAVQEMRDLIVSLGSTRTGNFRVVCAAHHVLTGHWDAAVSELVSVAELPETQFLPLAWHGLSAFIAGHRDDQATAGLHLDAERDRKLTTGVVRTNAGWLLMARALCAERAGRPDQALAALMPGLAASEMPDRHQFLPDMVRLALTIGDVETAKTAAGACQSDDAAFPLPDGTAASKRCTALLCEDAEALLSVASHYEDRPRPMELAATLEDAAALLARQGETAKAREAHAESIRVFTALGARWDIMRADARLRQCGIRRGARGPRRRPATGWASLTPTELKIAGLVAEGLSNPDIGVQMLISRHTVATHIAHILAKLGARSRTEIAREAARHP